MKPSSLSVIMRRLGLGWRIRKGTLNWIDARRVFAKGMCGMRGVSGMRGVVSGMRGMSGKRTIDHR